MAAAAPVIRRIDEHAFRNSAKSNRASQNSSSAELEFLHFLNLNTELKIFQRQFFSLSLRYERRYLAGISNIFYKPQ
jgi:hypothetical protein